VTSRILAPQEAFGFDRHLGAVAQTNVLGGLELHQHAGPVEFDAGHLSHRETGDLDAVAGPQAAGVSEIGGDGSALVEKGQLLPLQRGQSSTTTATATRPTAPMIMGLRSENSFILACTVPRLDRRP